MYPGGVALVIETIERAGLIAEKLSAHGTVWGWLDRININTLGSSSAVCSWRSGPPPLPIWRLGRIEERWGARRERSVTPVHLPVL